MDSVDWYEIGDIKMLQDDLEQGVRLAASLGIDVSDLEMPSFS